MYHRRVNSILPSDSVAMEKNDILRRERQSEYQEYMKKGVMNGLNRGQRGGNYGLSREKIVPSSPPKKSVAKIRQDMSRERDREISRNIAGSGRSRDREVVGSNDYASLRERKVAEERRYRGNTRDHDFGRKKYDEEETSDYSERSKTRPPHGSNWAEEETELMQWTRNQASAHRVPRSHTRAQTPPIVDSPRVKRTTSKSSLRSISAPSVAPPLTGIAALGKYEDSRVKRLRQLKYAEELKSQMKEKLRGKPPHATAWRSSEEESDTREGYRYTGTRGE